MFHFAKPNFGPEHRRFPLILQDHHIKTTKKNYQINSQIKSIWKDQIRKKEELRDQTYKKRDMNFCFGCANQSLILTKKKGLNILLSFKFGLKNSDYFKSITLNFVPQNQELTQLQDIFWHLKILICFIKNKLPRPTTNTNNFKGSNKKKNKIKGSKRENHKD